MEEGDIGDEDLGLVEGSSRLAAGPGSPKNSAKECSMEVSSVIRGTIFINMVIPKDNENPFLLEF